MFLPPHFIMGNGLVWRVCKTLGKTDCEVEWAGFSEFRHTPFARVVFSVPADGIYRAISHIQQLHHLGEERLIPITAGVEQLRTPGLA